jgi:ketosteroid isomerase-like protein
VAHPVAFSAPQSTPVRSDQEILVQLERDWDEAFRNKDLPFIERLLADEFVATYADGSRGDKAHELKLTAEFNQRVYASTLGDFTVKVLGDTAVVWFTKRMMGPKDGVEIEVAHRFMDVFVFRDGRWQCVATQSTKLTAP